MRGLDISEGLRRDKDRFHLLDSIAINRKQRMVKIKDQALCRPPSYTVKGEITIGETKWGAGKGERGGRKKEENGERR